MDDKLSLHWRGNFRAVFAIGVTFVFLPVVLGNDLLSECPQWAATVVPVRMTTLMDSFPVLTDLLPVGGGGDGPAVSSLPLCAHPTYASFLWSFCPSACTYSSYRQLGSLETWASSCETWATQGHCDDPASLTLMHTLCTSACGYQLTWDPVLRSRLGWALPLPDQREEAVFDHVVALNRLLQPTITTTAATTNDSRSNGALSTASSLASFQGTCRSDRSDVAYLIDRWWYRLQFLLFTPSATSSATSSSAPSPPAAFQYIFHTSSLELSSLHDPAAPAFAAEDTDEDPAAATAEAYQQFTDAVYRSQLQRYATITQLMTMVLRLYETVYLHWQEEIIEKAPPSRYPRATSATTTATATVTASSCTWTAIQPTVERLYASLRELYQRTTTAAGPAVTVQQLHEASRAVYRVYRSLEGLRTTTFVPCGATVIADLLSSVTTGSPDDVCSGVELTVLPLRFLHRPTTLFPTSYTPSGHHARPVGSPIDDAAKRLFGRQFPDVASPMPLVKHRLRRRLDPALGDYRVELTRPRARPAAATAASGAAGGSRRSPRQTPQPSPSSSFVPIAVPLVAFAVPGDTVGGGDEVVQRVLDVLAIGYRWLHLPALPDAWLSVPATTTTMQQATSSAAAAAEAASSGSLYEQRESERDWLVGEALATALHTPPPPPPSMATPTATPMATVTRDELFLSVTLSVAVVRTFQTQLQATQPATFRRSFGGTRTAQATNWQRVVRQYLAERCATLGVAVLDAVIVDGRLDGEGNEDEEEALVGIVSTLPSLLCSVTGNDKGDGSRSDSRHSGSGRDSGSGGTGKRRGRDAAASSTASSTCLVRTMGLQDVSSDALLDRLVAAVTSSPWGPTATKEAGAVVYAQPVLYLQPHALYQPPSVPTVGRSGRGGGGSVVWRRARDVHRLHVVFTDAATTATVSAPSERLPFVDALDPVVTQVAHAHSTARQQFFHALLNDTLRPIVTSAASSTATGAGTGAGAAPSPSSKTPTKTKPTATGASGGSVGGGGKKQPPSPQQQNQRHPKQQKQKQKERYQQTLASLYGDAIPVTTTATATGSASPSQPRPRPPSGATATATASANAAATNVAYAEEDEAFIRAQESPSTVWMYDVDAVDDDAFDSDAAWVHSLLYRRAALTGRQWWLLYQLQQDVGVMVSWPYGGGGGGGGVGRERGDGGGVRVRRHLGSRRHLGARAVLRRPRYHRWSWSWSHGRRSGLQPCGGLRTA